MPDEAGGSVLLSVCIVHGVVAPRAVVVGRGERTGGIQKGNDVALRVEDVVVERRGRAVVIDHGERLVAVVVDKLKRFAVPLLTHDLAGERRVGIGRITDLLAAADTSHVIGVLHGLAAHDGLCELTPLRPVEMVVTAVVVRDRVAGGREVARLRLPLIQDILGRAVRRHAREQIRPRGVRVAKGLRDCAVFRDAADVARRVVGATAQRDTADNDDDLWLCADGCTHHGDHLSISLQAVLVHRPLATNENWGFEADLIAGAVRLIRTKILKECSDKLLILLVFENSGYQSHGQEP